MPKAEGAALKGSVNMLPGKAMGPAGQARDLRERRGKPRGIPHSPPVLRSPTTPSLPIKTGTARARPEQQGLTK